MKKLFFFVSTFQTAQHRFVTCIGSSFANTFSLLCLNITETETTTETVSTTTTVQPTTTGEPATTTEATTTTVITTTPESTTSTQETTSVTSTTPAQSTTATPATTTPTTGNRYNTIYIVHFPRLKRKIACKLYFHMEFHEWHLRQRHHKPTL